MMSESAAVKSSPGRDLVVLVSSFLVYMNFGITFVNGLIVKEMLVIFQAGETLTTWVASLQIGLCLFVGKETHGDALLNSLKHGTPYTNMN